jgi:hypothetical protein
MPQEESQKLSEDEKTLKGTRELDFMSPEEVDQLFLPQELIDADEFFANPAKSLERTQVN